MSPSNLGIAFVVSELPDLRTELQRTSTLDPPHRLCNIISIGRSTSSTLGLKLQASRRTFVGHGHDHAAQALAVLAAPGEAEVVRQLLPAGPYIDDVGLYTHVLHTYSQ